MRTTLTALLSTATFLTATATAQTITATPTGHKLETTEGDDQLAKGWHAGFTLFFGTYQEARYQYADNELTDNKVRVMTALSFRPDNYSARRDGGRSWKNVNLTVNELDYKNLSRTYASNLISPTQVFSGSVSWPTLANTANRTVPAPITAPYTFKFASPFIASGTKALLADFQFSGGSLSNGSVWGTQRVSYSLDGVFIATSMGTGASRFPAQDHGCNDSAVTATKMAEMVSSFTQYSKASTFQPDTIHVPIYSRYTAPNAPVVHAVGFKGSTTGVNLGFGCNNLYLDFSQPVFYFLAQAGALPNAQTPRQTFIGPRNAVNLGLEIWSQGAWTDSKTGRFSLTAARRAKAPNLGMTDVLPQKRMVYAYNNMASTNGSITSESQGYNHPISLWQH